MATQKIEFLIQWEAMNKETTRVYVDSTVVSGMFDYHLPERITQTKLFWDAVQRGEFAIIVSSVQRDEMMDAPQYVREFYNDLPVSQIERIESTEESDNLAMQYVDAKVISKNHLNDCRHIAIASIAQADAVVSWNCNDMVNPNRIPKYNEVNEKNGYKKN